MQCSREGAANLGYYSRTVRDAGILYNSTSYFDDLAWGAVWLYKRTGDASYLTAAQQYHVAQLPYVPTNDPGRGLVFDWDNVMPGVSYLLAEAAGFRNSSYNTLVRDLAPDCCSEGGPVTSRLPVMACRVAAVAGKPV